MEEEEEEVAGGYLPTNLEWSWLQAFRQLMHVGYYLQIFYISKPFIINFEYLRTSIIRFSGKSQFLRVVHIKG